MVGLIVFGGLWVALFFGHVQAEPGLVNVALFFSWFLIIGVSAGVFLDGVVSARKHKTALRRAVLFCCLASHLTALVWFGHLVTAVFWSMMMFFDWVSWGMAEDRVRAEESEKAKGGATNGR